MASFAERLRELRLKKDIGQKEVGAIIAVSDSSIRKYETGERTPDPVALIKLADFFNVSLDYLLGRVDYDMVKTPEYIISKAETMNLPGDFREALAIYKDMSDDEKVNELKLAELTYKKLKSLPDADREAFLRLLNSLTSASK